MKGKITDTSGNIIREELSYQLGDVAFIDINMDYLGFINDETKAFPDHSGVAIDILGDKDAAKYWNICVIAADFTINNRRVRMFEPDPANESGWLTRYTYGQNKIGRASCRERV